MSEEKRNPCPTCQGQGMIPGVCESSQEWCGSLDDGDDMHCTPDQVCPTCEGKGEVE